MSRVPIRWKVSPILKAHGVTPYRFWKDAELSSKVAYAIANDEHAVIDTGVVEKVVPYLRRLTGDNSIQLGDVAEYVEH